MAKKKQFEIDDKLFEALKKAVEELEKTEESVKGK